MTIIDPAPDSSPSMLADVPGVLKHFGLVLGGNGCCDSVRLVSLPKPIPPGSKGF